MAWNPEPKTVLDYLVYIGRITLPQTTICTTWPSQYRRKSTQKLADVRFINKIEQFWLLFHPSFSRNVKIGKSTKVHFIYLFIPSVLDHVAVEVRSEK